MQTAKDSADLLLTLLNEILDYSRIEAGKFTLDAIPFRLSATLDEAMRTLAVKAYEKGLELTCDLPADLPDALVGDPMRLRQVLLNLLGNAIKFTEHGEVTLRIAELSESESEVELEFSVSDTGIGIAEEDQKWIFAPFTQADASSTRHYGGTGLGLAIATSLVAMMGGRLRWKSAPGQGSVFTFTARCAPGRRK